MKEQNNSTYTAANGSEWTIVNGTFNGHAYGWHYSNDEGEVFSAKSRQEAIDDIEDRVAEEAADEREFMLELAREEWWQM